MESSNNIDKNEIGTISVKEICENEYSFYIPGYQRGYRWTEFEVKELLNDIYDFKSTDVKTKNPETGEEETGKTWYCLQPIVIKKHKDDKQSGSQKCFDVIDGQQRLTTIYLILFYLNSAVADDEKQKLFSIEYETRTKRTNNDGNVIQEGSSDFLKHPGNEDESNIDFHYMHRAYDTIGIWCKDNGINDWSKKWEFNSKVRDFTKFIWYEINEKNPIDVFTRLNTGKIELTDSELIKALFLNGSNTDNSNSIDSQKNRIAREWDSIEYALQDDKLWYFLGSKKEYPCRIEYLFNLIKQCEGYKEDNDPHPVFNWYYAELETANGEKINRQWDNVQKHYQDLVDWFNDRELYHKIGFILTINTSDSVVVDLYKLYSPKDKNHAITKTEFRKEIDRIIRNYFNGGEKNSKKIYLDELDYEKDKSVIGKILLLYNVLTMLNEGVDSLRFPFDSYRKEHWDIEHIAPQTDLNDAGDFPKEERMDWINDAYGYLRALSDPKAKKYAEGIEEERDKGSDLTDDSVFFDKLYEPITKYFNQGPDDDTDDTDDTDENSDYKNKIFNLALLDTTTNRGYGNSIFPVKRQWIVDREKKGAFVPICTKNVFLKYFSDSQNEIGDEEKPKYIPRISFWVKDDRIAYENDMKNILKEYVEAERQNEKSGK